MTASLLLIIAYSISPYSLLLQRRSSSSINPTIQQPVAGGGGEEEEVLSSEQYSCVSRQQLHIIRSSYSSSKPSPFLLSRLKEYEQRHKRCDPFSESFNRSSRELKPEEKEDVELDCRYIVWTPVNGLGNRMLSISSSFLYALLTNRVLLVDFGPDMVDLFCEPFHNSTWFLPRDFTFKGRANTPEFRETYSLGKLLRREEEEEEQKKEMPYVASLLQLFLSYDNDDYDKLFFKSETQPLLEKVPWLVLRSDQYFAPYLFLMPCFRAELDRMFPDDKETVFHHLGRYLFSPSNQVWGHITGFYDAYLAKADRRIGLQIRVFSLDKTPASLILSQVINCIQEESRIIILPNATTTTTTTASSSGRNRTTTTTTAILVASLFGQFYTELNKMYKEWNEKAGATVVGVYRTNHEEIQVLGSSSHNMKALVDIYLLSMCDVLVTSPRSTFGYVAHGLAGLTPWILQSQDIEDEEQRVKEPACRRGVSKEPCLQFHANYYDTNPDHREPGGPVPVIMDCEDFQYGLKLVNRRV
ncbi:unnamed protein product [Linum tenue]|uniref:Fucosyltransferase n=1 Tax=Linum tenue TaxID=586396 RepID=A0AAV0QX29_9ROSI|nr:unnamed protein product [Linum tenue]